MDLTVYTTGDWVAEPVPEPVLSSTFLSFTVTIRNNGAGQGSGVGQEGSAAEDGVGVNL